MDVRISFIRSLSISKYLTRSRWLRFNEVQLYSLFNWSDSHTKHTGSQQGLGEVKYSLFNWSNSYTKHTGSQQGLVEVKYSLFNWSNSHTKHTGSQQGLGEVKYSLFNWSDSHTKHTGSQQGLVEVIHSLFNWSDPTQNTQPAGPCWSEVLIIQLIRSHTKHTASRACVE